MYTMIINKTSDLIGGFYEKTDSNIYYITSDKASSISTDSTKLIAENTALGINIKESSLVKLDLDGNGIEDISVNIYIDIFRGKVIEIETFASTILATTSEAGFPSTPDAVEALVNGSAFSHLTLTYDVTIDPIFHFIVKTGANNFAIAQIELVLGHWTFKYQTWKVKHQILVRGAMSLGWSHSRTSPLPSGIFHNLIVHSSSTKPILKPIVGAYVRGAPRRGLLLGDFPDFPRPQSSITAQGAGQLAAYGDILAFAVDSDVRITALWDIGKSIHTFSLGMTKLNSVTSLLIRHNPTYPEEVSGKIQLIVADFKTSSNFHLLESDISDLSTPPKATTTSIAFKNQDGSTYTFAPGELWDLSWANDEQTAFYVPEPSKNRVIRFALSSDGREAIFEAEYLGMTEPRTVLVASPTQLYVICKNEIGSLRIDPEFDTGYDVLGIGFVPFSVNDKSSGMDVDIIHKTTGLANTSKLQNWPLYAKDLPFGDKLSLMINHKSLYDNGIRYYDVTLIDPTGPKSYPIVNQFTDIRGGSETFTDAKAGKYPIRENPLDWYFPHLAAVIDTNNVLSGKSGVFELRVQFYEEDGKKVGTPFSRNVSIDNRTPSVEIGQPEVGKVEVGSCGSVSYDNKSTDKLLEKCTFRFDGTGVPYGISTYCGSSYVKDFSQSGTTAKTEEEIKIEGTVSSALGACEAGLMSIRASIGNPVTNGYSVYTHGASQALYFALYPKPKP